MTTYDDNMAAIDRELHMLNGIATTSKQRLPELRRQGIRRTLRFINMGHTKAAREFMFISVEQQARAVGLRDVYLPRDDVS